MQAYREPSQCTSHARRTDDFEPVSYFTRSASYKLFAGVPLKLAASDIEAVGGVESDTGVDELRAMLTARSTARARSLVIRRHKLAYSLTSAS